MAPPLPALKLPVPPRRLGPGAIIAIVVHVVVLGAILWERSTYLEQTLGGPGPRGGGGTGASSVRFFSLPAASPPAAAPVRPPPPTPPVAVTPLPIVDIKPLALPQVAIQPQPVTLVGAATGTSASSPGSGGGSGGGAGPGTGTSTGPGTGGDGGYILPADPRGILIPPTCARGQFKVQFWVESDGKVSHVEIDPLPKEAQCRREFVAAMREYKFRPAQTRDGRTVSSIFTGYVKH